MNGGTMKSLTIMILILIFSCTAHAFEYQQGETIAGIETATNSITHYSHLGIIGQSIVQLNMSGIKYSMDAGYIQYRTFSPNYPNRAIIVASSEGPYDPLWYATQMIGDYAYQVLSDVGFETDHMAYLSSDNSLEHVTAKASSENLTRLLSSDWARQSNDLILFLVGHGGENKFVISYKDDLRASTLNNTLNDLQQHIQGKIICIIEACQSGSFIPQLISPTGRPRFIITSAAGHEPAYFLIDGGLSFSYQFWTSVFRGCTINIAFDFGRKMMHVYQHALIDSNGDGIADNKDIRQAANDKIGQPEYPIAEFHPWMNSMVHPRVLYGDTSIQLTVNNIVNTDESLDTIEVLAIIVPPGFQKITETQVLDKVYLDGPDMDGNFTATYNKISNPGAYTITFYAIDHPINSHTELYSEPLTSVVIQRGTDIYENDNDSAHAQFIMVNDHPQAHCFKDPNDEDWFKFNGVEGRIYTIRTFDLESNADTVITLLDSALNILVGPEDISPGPGNESFDWICPTDGTYYIQILHHDETIYGDHTCYTLQFFYPVSHTSKLEGFITNADTGDAIGGVEVCVDGESQCRQSFPNGRYFFNSLYSDNCWINVQHPGFLDYIASVNLRPDMDITHNIALIPHRAYTINFNKGLNFFVLPVIMEDVTTNYDLFDLLGGCKDIQKMSLYQNKDIPLFCLEIDGNPYGEPSELNNYQGVWLMMRQAKTISFEGRPVNLPLQLNKGLNITGLPSIIDGKTAYELFDILGAANMNSIEFFDTADTAYFKVQMVEGQHSGKDFYLKAGMAYIIKMNVDLVVQGQ